MMRIKKKYYIFIKYHFLYFPISQISVILCSNHKNHSNSRIYKVIHINPHNNYGIKSYIDSG